MKGAFILLMGLLTGATANASQADLEQLLQDLRQERRAEQDHHRQREARFLAQRDQRRALLERAREEQQQAQALAQQLRSEYAANATRLQALQTELAQASADLSELFAHARQTAADTQARQQDSLLALQLLPAQHLQGLADQAALPSLAQLKTLWLSLLEEMQQSGRIHRLQAPVIAPDGSESTRQILRIGSFTAISQGHYLRYLPEAARFVQPARQPALRELRAAAEFEQAEQGLHPLSIDPSRGEILGLLGRSPSLAEHIRQAGIIGYLILGLGAFALLLVLERLLILAWVRMKMRRQKRQATAQANNPIGRLRLLARSRHLASLEALDLALDEAVTRESNRLSRGLISLGVVAAMAPLLGLLGTVTGMIETFQAITLFGSGDPKLMSSGISQALVTTQLGLVVAVPIMLLHSLIKGRANQLIAQLDSEVSLLLGERA